MKIPEEPTPMNELMDKIYKNARPNTLQDIFLNPEVIPAQNGKYYHWDKIKSMKPPNGLNNEEWWLGIKVARSKLSVDLPFIDKIGNSFTYATVDVLNRALHLIDGDASGAIAGKQAILGPATRASFYIKSLFEEAITSSQLEGAVTTRQVAKQMLSEGRKPRDRSEQMIFNNYHAMLFLQEMREEKLSKENIFELHRILVSNTLDDETGAGRFRRKDEDIVVVDINDGQVLHVPPNADELPDRLAKFCEIANVENGAIFLHPVIMGILLHFALAYDHPFIDGNGRTARAIFYWYMARRGYWLMEYLSISNILLESPAQYAKSFLYSESDDNDMTYFITYQLRVIQKAIEKLHRSLRRKMNQVPETEQLLIGNQNLFASLNHRQIALLNHGLRNDGVNYSIETHKNLNNISYQTARTDLLNMVDFGLLEKLKIGRAFLFRLPRDLKENIKKIDL